VFDGSWLPAGVVPKSEIVTVSGEPPPFRISR
jgi:hypothetical protein